MEYAPPDHTTTDLRLCQLPSGRDLSVTVHRYVGGDGPTVYVQATQHGIELNGPAALRRLHDRLLDTDIAGTVVVVPVANPLAFDHRSYMTPSEYDVMNPNLNRVWPGDADGSFQERAAARLWELVVETDVAVDLHTGTADMLEHVRYHESQDGARRLAEAFGTAYRLADTRETDSEDPSGGTFRAAAARADIPAITAELSNSRQITHSAIETGVDGLENLLRATDSLDGEPTETVDQTALENDSNSVTASTSGLFELRAGISVGDTLTEGTELGTVYSPSTYEERETVTVDEGGVAYSVAREAVVVAGERLAGIATKR